VVTCGVVGRVVLLIVCRAFPAAIELEAKVGRVLDLFVFVRRLLLMTPHTWPSAHVKCLELWALHFCAAREFRSQSRPADEGSTLDKGGTGHERGRANPE
jgi:hypothetical protein